MVGTIADYGMIADSIKQVTPEDYALQKQQLSNLALNNGAGRVKLDKDKYDINSDKIIRQSVQNNTIIDPATGAIKTDHEKVAADLVQRGLADKAVAYMDKQHQATYDKHKEALGAMAQAAQGVLSQPEEVRPQAYQSALAQIKSLGIDTTGAPEQYDANFLTGIINTAVDAKTHFEADNKLKTATANSGGENVFLSTPEGYIAANKRTTNTKPLISPEGKPYIPSNIDIDAQTALVRNKKKAEADVELATKPEIERQVAMAKLAEERKNKASESGDKYAALLSGFDEAKAIIPLSTGSSLGSLKNAAGKTIGFTSEAAQNTKRLKALQAWLVTQVPKPGGAVSDADLVQFKDAVGNIAEDIPQEERMAGIETAERIIKKYQSSLGGKNNSSTTPTVSNW